MLSLYFILFGLIYSFLVNLFFLDTFNTVFQVLFPQLNWLWVPLIATLPITGTTLLFSLHLFLVPSLCKI